MSIAFNFLITFWLTTPNAVVLSVCIGVGGCLCPRNSKTCLAGTAASRQLMNNALTSASAAEDSTALIICEMVITAPLLSGVSASLDMKKCPPALLCALLLDRYDTSLCAANTMSLALYVTIASGCVAA